MTKCIFCGREFEPVYVLPIIEDLERGVDEVFGVQPIRRQICPACLLEKIAKMLSAFSRALR